MSTIPSHGWFMALLSQHCVRKKCDWIFPWKMMTGYPYFAGYFHGKWWLGIPLWLRKPPGCSFRPRAAAAWLLWERQIKPSSKVSAKKGASRRMLSAMLGWNLDQLADLIWKKLGGDMSSYGFSRNLYDSIWFIGIFIWNKICKDGGVDWFLSMFLASG